MTLLVLEKVAGLTRKKSFRMVLFNLNLNSKKVDPIWIKLFKEGGTDLPTLTVTFVSTLGVIVPII